MWSWIWAARRRRVDLLVGGVRLGEAQVVGDRGVEEVRLLGDDADRAGEGVEVEVAHVDPVEGDPAAGDVVQPRHQVAERGLAGAGRADDGEAAAGRDGEVDAVEGRARVLARRSAKSTSSKRTSPRDLRRGGPGRSGSVMSTGRSRYSKMRWKSASEVWICTPVDSRLTAGRNRPCWSETKATSVPMETAGPPNWSARPAAQ